MIKGKTTYYLFSMALAACLTAFPACSADEAAVQEPAPVNPTYDGHTVKTQFAISIPRPEANKRMTAGHTQNNNNFLGMEAIRLIPLDTPYDEVGNAAGNTYLDYMIGLNDIDDFNSDDDSNYDDTDQEGIKIYKDVSIPVGTQSFLFYGEAMRDADATDFTQGALETSLDGGNVRTVGDIRFGLKGILGDTDIETPKQALLNQLNTVMDVDGWDTQRPEKGESDTDEPSMEEKTLANLYANMQKLQAGSAEAIRTTLENLYHTVASIADATDETDQKTIAGNIRTAIISKADGNENALFAPSDGKALAWADGIEETVSSFPTAQDLPEGAMQLAWDETGSLFKYVDENHNNGEGITVGSVDKVALNSLTYPAALAYHVCTAAKANDDPSAPFPSAGDWTDAPWSGWGDQVEATSRLVALKDNIQYSVASLATTVRFASENLPDQSGSLVVTGDQTFSLTGILVGGQPDKVGFDFLPDAATAQFDRTVYDHDIEPGSASGGTVYVTTTATSENYTLLLDNNQGEENNKGQTVNFAIELKNHGEDFRGVDGNLIAKGMTFYLVGQLKPDDGSGEALNEAVDHIFVRDYTTTANVTIHSLQNAYLTIPDLRATNLRLALSVDLQWQQGYTQDVTLP